jgi:hypothetical protein
MKMSDGNGRCACAGEPCYAVKFALSLETIDSASFMQKIRISSILHCTPQQNSSTAPQEICFWGHQQLSLKPLTQAAVSANRVMSLAYRVTKVYLERNVSLGH